MADEKIMSSNKGHEIETAERQQVVHSGERLVRHHPRPCHATPSDLSHFYALQRVTENRLLHPELAQLMMKLRADMVFFLHACVRLRAGRQQTIILQCELHGGLTQYVG